MKIEDSEDYNPIVDLKEIPLKQLKAVHKLLGSLSNGRERESRSILSDKEMEQKSLFWDQLDDALDDYHGS